MKKYDGDDEVTMYFIIRRRKHADPEDAMIAAYSDNRALAEAYIEFHNCDIFKLKTIHEKFDNICKILNENPHDEIEIVNISVRDPDNPHKSKLLAVPMTRTEQVLVNGESISLMATRINYSAISASMDFFKDKYRKAFEVLHFKDAIDVARESKHVSKFISSIEIDDLVVFYRSCPDIFG